VALACDLYMAAAQATARLRRGMRVATRGVLGVVRAHGPVVAARMMSFRALPGSGAATVASLRPSGTHASRPGGPPHSAHRSTPHDRPVNGAHRELVLPADPTAPGMARAFLRSAAQEWGVDDDLAQDAAMVLTELVANAVDHARSESTLSLRVAHEGLCVAVRDAHPGPVPRPAPIDPTAARGRGLQMVDALTTAWGVTSHDGGKTVWAVLGPTRD
jgi:anti-sigma regulatory factor (Ser/Thr protein kinase)